MATKTEALASEFKINYLTEAQYQEAVTNGEINENEIYMTPDTSNGVPSGGSSGQILGYSTSGKAYWTNTIADPIFTGSVSRGRKSDTTIGTYSIALGNSVESSGSYSFAEGYQTVSSGIASHAEGQKTTASGDYSHAEGYQTTVSAQYSHAEGVDTNVTSNAAHAEGSNSTASAFCSHAEGNGTTSSGMASHSEGVSTNASGSASHAEGWRTTALENQHAQGHYNDTSLATKGNTSGGTTGTAFVIGNGTSDSASNACRITYAGAVIGKSAYQSTGADFAELREWSDGNPNGEDRRGYFVTMEGMNIKIASPGDYICGIISANPSVIGNNDEDWMGRYVFDEFGAFVYETKEETDPETGETHTYTRYKENPEYDPTREYEFRADRPEWDYVGLCGVIHVRDDGTCQTNGFCKCAAGGIATASERGYRVLERVNDHIIKVLFYLTGEIF